MKKKIGVFVVAAMLTALAGTHALAAARCEGNNIIISGNVLLKQKDLPVAIQIIGPFSKNISDVKAALMKDIGSEIALENTYYNETLTGEEGAYSFTFSNAKTGNFYAIAVKEPDKELYTQTLYIADQSTINTVLYALNRADNVQDIKAVFDDPAYHNLLIENYRILAEMESESDKLKVYRLLLNDRGEFFNSFTAFETSLVRNAAIVRTGIETNAEKALGYSEYIDFSTANEKLYAEYKDLTANKKAEVIGRIMGQKPENLTEYIKRFDESCFLQKIKDEKYSTNITAFLKDHQSAFGLDLSGYSLCANEVNQKICGNDHRTISEFKRALAYAVSSSGSSSTGAGGSSGGGGGSSSGGGAVLSGIGVGASVNIPQAQVIVENKGIFSDINSVPWAKAAIEALAKRGIVSGKSEGCFCPNDTVKREEFIKIAVGAFDLEDDECEVNFADVDKNEWYYRYIASGVKADLMLGIDDDLFGTGLGLTRQDLAVVIYRYLSANGKTFGEPDYLFVDDDKIADYAKEAVYALKSAGIISGTDHNSFEPTRQATRAEVAKIIASVI